MLEDPKISIGKFDFPDIFVPLYLFNAESIAGSLLPNLDQRIVYINNCVPKIA